MGSSHTICVHKGVPNRGRPRISMDVRYPPGKPINIDNASPDGQPLSWDCEVSNDWPSDTLKHHWQSLPLSLKSSDPPWSAKRNPSGFEFGGVSGPRARSALQRGSKQKLHDALP